MKYILFLSIGVVLSIKALAGEQIQQMHEYFYPLKAGYFQYIENSSLEGPTAFRGLYGEDNCFKLNIDGKFVDWIYEAVKTKSTLILYKCIDHKEHNYADGALIGDVDNALYELANKNNNWVLKKIDIPGLELFHNGAICNEKIAYWGEFESSVFVAVVYDFKTRKIIKRKKLGAFDLATGDKNYLSQPTWDNTCNKVTFEKQETMNETVTISLK